MVKNTHENTTDRRSGDMYSLRVSGFTGKLVSNLFSCVYLCLSVFICGSSFLKHLFFHARLYILRQMATHLCDETPMPIPQFGVRGFMKACYAAKKTLKWHMFLGWNSCDKICHLVCKRLDGIQHKGFNELQACWGDGWFGGAGEDRAYGEVVG